MTLALLAIAYPEFTFRYERRGPKPDRFWWVAVRTNRPDPGVAVVITSDLTELIAALGEPEFWNFTSLMRLAGINA